MNARRLLASACLWLAAGWADGATPPGDPLHTGADSVELDAPSEEPVRILAPNTVFKVPDGQRDWERACQQVVEPGERSGLLPRRASDVSLEGFRRVVQFRSEVYARCDESCELLWAISADEAVAQGQLALLKGLRIVYFTEVEELSRGPEKAGARSVPEPLRRSRLVLSAREGAFNMATAEGQASGNVRIEVYGEARPKEQTEFLGELACDSVRWRAWSDPASGSSELCLYAIAPVPGGQDPPVTGKFHSRNADGTRSEIQLRAEGMLFRAGVLDHRSPVLDFEGRKVGVTKVQQRRVLFHGRIRVIIEGTDLAPLLPFQQAPVAAAKDARAEPPRGPPGRSRVEVTCEGPALLNLAAAPYKFRGRDPDQEAPLSAQFQFLNGVLLQKFPVAPPGEQIAAITSPVGWLHCRHLCLQYPLGTLGGLPEYAEALGSVLMRGLRVMAGGHGPKPFRADAQRVYYDGLNDSTVFQGQPGSPVEVVDELGEVSAQNCRISRKTQVMEMWGQGPKRAVVRGTPPAARGTDVLPPARPLDLGAHDLTATWRGLFRRKIISVPAGPGQPELIKEELSLSDEVQIHQPERGLRVEGQKIVITRNARTGQVECLEGREKMLVRSGDMQVKGDYVKASLSYDAQDRLTQNTILVMGNPGAATQAVLWQGASAVRSPRFVIDALNNNFQAYGGIVARMVLAPPPGAQPKPEAVGGAALIPALGRGDGTRLGFQCDGDFEFESRFQQSPFGAPAGRLRAAGDVLVHQADLQIISDELLLWVQKPAPAQPPPGEARKPDEKQKAVPEGLFAGDVRSVECLGRVEVATPSQLAHCDRLLYDLASQKVFLESADPDQPVRVYLKQPSGQTKLLQVAQRIEYDQNTGSFRPLARMYLRPYKDPGPQQRPARPKAAPAGGAAP